MKKVKAKTEMRNEYDFSKAVKGKHADNYAKRKMGLANP